MLASFLSRLASLLLVAPRVGAVRQDAAESSHGSSLSNVSSPFQCPDACQECCTAHRWDLGLLAWGVSKEKYKCILKSSRTSPSEDCDESEVRTHAARQAKAKCPFKQSELGSQPWSQLVKTPCSKHTACCCRKTWTEYRCFGMEKTAAFVTAPSTHKEAEEGRDETYKRISQTYKNKKACVGREGLDFQRSVNDKLGKQNRCCVKTKDSYEMKKVNCRMEGHMCDEWEMQFQVGGDTWCEEEVCDHKKVWWKECVAYQQLYQCSEKGQEHVQTGMMYQRVSTDKGMCVGDQSTPESLERLYGPGDYQGVRLSTSEAWSETRGAYVVAKCPAGYTSGRDCTCGEDCGKR